MREGDALRRLSWVTRCGVRRELSEFASLRAVELLDACPPGAELVLARVHVAMLALNAQALERAVALGCDATDVAEAVGAPAAVVHALNTDGTATLLADTPSGIAELERSLDRARRRAEAASSVAELGLL